VEEQLGSEEATSLLTKKELLNLTREKERLDRALGGIKEMGGVPDILFVIDTNREEIAIQEARKLGIPVVAVVDSNCNPNVIDYPIPGNDDAARAIALYLDLISRSVISGLQREQVSVGTDIGESEEPPVEAAVAADAAADAPAEPAPGA
jgi:small subunit ribosomal protein S2